MQRVRSATGLLVVALLLLVLAGWASAAILWRSESVISVSVTPAPYELVAGAGSSKTRYVQGFALSADATSFSATLSGKAGGDAFAKDVFRIASASDATQSVNVLADPVSHASILGYNWTIRDGTTTIATLDMLAGSPSVTLSIPTGASYEVDLRLKLAKGASAPTTLLTSQIRSVVT